MKRMGLWLLIVALCLSGMRIGMKRRESDEVITKCALKGFVYRAPWNGKDQLTVLSLSFNGILQTNGYNPALLSRLAKGCYVEFETVRLSKPKNNRNPGVFNYRTYLLSRNVSYILQAKENQISFLDYIPARYWLHLPGARFRSKAYTLLDAVVGPDAGALVHGVMTGDTGAMEERDILAFRESGLAHLMAVSGTHVAFILAPFRRVVKNRFCLYKLRNFLLLIPLLVFWVLTDGTPSVTRACISCAGLFLAHVLERPFDGCNFLMLSAGIQLMIYPYMLYSSGFLMSYGAAVGIYFVYPFIQKNIPYFADHKEMVRSVRMFDRQALGAGISVNLVLCPLMLYLFGSYSVCGMLLTLYASLPAGALCAGGYLLCVVDILPFSSILKYAIGGFLTAVVAFLRFVARLGIILPEPLGQIRISGIPLWTVAGYYLLLAILIIYGRHIRRLLVIFLIFIVGTYTVVRYHAPILSVLFVDVGQGSCVVVRADGYCGLIDTGDGKTDLTDVLWAQGIDRLDFLVLTHGHQDHIGGLESILTEYAPGVLYISRNEEEGLNKASVLANQYGVSVCEVAHQDCIQFGRVQVEFLVCETFFNQSDESKENNASLNMRISCAYGNVLICGDLEEAGIEALLQMNAFTQTDLLFVPHHGSNSGTSKKMLSNILPKYAIISVGIRNSYGHPGSETLLNLEQAGALIYRTDLNGGISVTFGMRSWFRKRCVKVWPTLS